MKPLQVHQKHGRNRNRPLDVENQNNKSHRTTQPRKEGTVRPEIALPGEGWPDAGDAVRFFKTKDEFASELVQWPTPCLSADGTRRVVSSILFFTSDLRVHRIIPHPTNIGYLIGMFRPYPHAKITALAIDNLKARMKCWPVEPGITWTRRLLKLIRAHNAD